MESLKTILVVDIAGAGIRGKKFPINLGNGEVISLKSLYFNIYGTTPAAGSNAVGIGLYRKSEKLPPSVQAVNDADMIWEHMFKLKYVTETIQISENRMVVFPQPIILIRPPQLVSLMGGWTAPNVEMRLYYTINRVSEKVMTELMSKDHE